MFRVCLSQSLHLLFVIICEPIIQCARLSNHALFCCIYLANKMVFFSLQNNPINLDLSYKMDLDAGIVLEEKTPSQCKFCKTGGLFKASLA